MAVEALLRVLTLPRGAIWEPAYGRGAIANVLRAHGHHVVCSDLIDYGTDPTAIHGMDFLKTTKVPDGVGCIVTNPPYMLANEFTAHALKLCPNVVMLLRLAFAGIGAAIADPGWRAGLGASSSSASAFP